MPNLILIIDFGSQYTQLIARRVRELNVCSEILPYNRFTHLPKNVKGIEPIKYGKSKLKLRLPDLT